MGPQEMQPSAACRWTILLLHWSRSKSAPAEANRAITLTPAARCLAVNYGLARCIYIIRIFKSMGFKQPQANQCPNGCRQDLAERGTGTMVVQRATTVQLWA